MVLMLVVLAGCVTDDINLRMERLEKQVIELEDRIEDLEAAQRAKKKPGIKASRRRV
jgi:outer membrane murein-binding lipoprotein Lpp